jgi:LacI family transcriptional regulator
MATRRARTTAADVARRAGTSPAVVSYVVNDGPRPVSRSTRARVQAAIDELGYRPNPVGRALRTRTANTLGVLVPTLRVPFFAQLVAALELEADRCGLRTLIGTTGFSPASEAAYAASLDDQQVAGLIIAGAGSRSRLPVLGAPVVHVHHRPSGHAGPVVRADDRDAGRQAAAHLLGVSGAMLVCVAPARPIGPVRDRVAGIRRTVDDAGRTGDLVELAAPYDRRQARDRLLERVDDLGPSAGIVAVTDEHAVGVLAALQLAGRSIGSSTGTGVRVVSIDGTPETETTAPALSAVTIPIPALARRAVGQVLDPLSTQPAALPVRLVTRASS